MHDVEMTDEEFEAMAEVSRYAEHGVGWQRLRRDPVACACAVERGLAMILTVKDRRGLTTAARSVCIYHVRRAAAAAARIVAPEAR